MNTQPLAVPAKAMTAEDRGIQPEQDFQDKLREAISLGAVDGIHCRDCSWLNKTARS